MLSARSHLTVDIVHVLKISSTISIMLAHVENPKSSRFDLSPQGPDIPLG